MVERFRWNLCGTGRGGGEGWLSGLEEGRRRLLGNRGRVKRERNSTFDSPCMDEGE